MNHNFIPIEETTEDLIKSWWDNATFSFAEFFNVSGIVNINNTKVADIKPADACPDPQEKDVEAIVKSNFFLSGRCFTIHVVKL